jgi:hypothetical protein
MTPPLAPATANDGSESGRPVAGPSHGPGRGLRGLVWIALAGLAAILWACLAPPLSLSPSGQDGATDNRGNGGGDGVPNLVGLFTIAGCSELSFAGPTGEPRCLGTAPLTVQLVLLEVGSTMHRWTVAPSSELRDLGVPGDAGSRDGGTDGGSGDGSLLDEAQSRARAPQLTLQLPGTYVVSLAVAGPGGTATATGQIVVSSGSLGSACTRDSQCGEGLLCLCGSGQPGRDGACPGGLAAGLCTKSCDGTSCSPGSVCIDLSRTQGKVAMDGGVGDAFRRPICVPACGTGKCRADLVCRDLPVLAPDGKAGDPLSWGRGCFAQVPGGVGAACFLSDGKTDSLACASGLCEGLGLRGLCTAACSMTSPCPSEAACATWNTPTLPPAPTGPRCLARCDAMRPCADPLFECINGGGPGPLGFRLLTEPASTTVCGPRRCMSDTECPGGRCVLLGATRYCTR